MKRLLCIVSAMNTGGAETFLMKMNRSIDRSKYSMDFCVNSDINYYEKEIELLGGRIYKIPSKSENILAWFNGLKRIVKDGKYNYVIRVSEHSLATLDLLVARFGGAKHLIMRSSNASSENKRSMLIHKIFFMLPRIIPTVKLAPSTEAAEYTWGKGCINKGKVQLLHNGLDLNYYCFNKEQRSNIRKQLKIEDKIVIGHVGRFSAQKNHSFLLSVFKELTKRMPSSVLLLVGDGELKDDIILRSQELGVQDRVILTGVRADIPNLLSAMDVFVFPSMYEGMPNTVIEAQATGLACVISDSITKEANITGLVQYLPLDSGLDKWVDCIITQAEKTRTGIQGKRLCKEYSLETTVNRFQRLVFGDD